MDRMTSWGFGNTRVKRREREGEKAKRKDPKERRKVMINLLLVFFQWREWSKDGTLKENNYDMAMNSPKN